MQTLVVTVSPESASVPWVNEYSWLRSCVEVGVKLEGALGALFSTIFPVELTADPESVPSNGVAPQITVCPSVKLLEAKKLDESPAITPLTYQVQEYVTESLSGSVEVLLVHVASVVVSNVPWSIVGVPVEGAEFEIESVDELTATPLVIPSLGVTSQVTFWFLV
jgi:hypothetical protein